MNWIKNIVRENMIGIAVAAFITLIVMWGMLLPGYILSLDLVLTPFYHLQAVSSSTALTSGTFINSLPLNYLFSFLYLFMPGWLVEKLVLISLFFWMSFFSFTYLPDLFATHDLGKTKRFETRLFVSLLYTANTFVYVRMLSGQWTHLFAYALLPLFLYLLFKSDRPIALSVCLALIALFSLHLFAMCLMVSLLWILINFNSLRKNITKVKSLAISLLFFLILCSYWIVPAVAQLQEHSLITSHFSEAHWQAFAASGHTFSLGTHEIHLPVIVNLLMLGGMWTEGYAFAQSFAWPQTQPLFWLSWICVIALAITGLIILSKTEKRKALFFSIIAIFSLIFASGVSATPFQQLNLWLFTHIPFWSGFRDSQKFIAFLSLSYVSLAGYGFEWMMSNIKNSFWSTFIKYVAFASAIAFGLFVWGGFHGQLKPVHYPQSWFEAKQIIDPQARILILPWQGYFSLNFNNNLITANPASSFFGPQAITSQNFRLGGIYDQSSDTSYSKLDQLITEQISDPNSATLLSTLKEQHISYIVFFQDIRHETTKVDPFSYSFLSSPKFKLIFNNPEVHIYTIEGE